MAAWPRPRWDRVLALELCLGVAAIGLCLWLCVPDLPVLVDKVRGVQQFYQAHDGRQVWVERMAETGERPTEVGLPLGLRPAWSSADEGGNLLWLCGDRRAPPGWQSGPASAASSAVRYAPCREGAVRW